MTIVPLCTRRLITPTSCTASGAGLPTTRRKRPRASRATAAPRRQQPRHALLRNLVPDELRRRRKRGIVVPHLHLRDHRRDLAIASRAAERVLERLLDHVADPSGRRRHEHAERQRRDFRAGELVAHELIAHLRSVAVHETQIPAIEREIDDRAEALARVRELVADRAVNAGGRERIAAERDDCRLRIALRHFLTRARSAPRAL